MSHCQTVLLCFLAISFLVTTSNIKVNAQEDSENSYYSHYTDKRYASVVQDYLTKAEVSDSTIRYMLIPQLSPINFDSALGQSIEYILNQFYYYSLHPKQFDNPLDDLIILGKERPGGGGNSLNKYTQLPVSIALVILDKELVISWLSHIWVIIHGLDHPTINHNLVQAVLHDNLNLHGAARIITEYYRSPFPLIRRMSNYAYTKNSQHLALRLAEIEESIYVHYKSNEAKKNIVKDISLYHDNDVFMVGYNQDRNRTGGGQISVSTDYVKLRWLNLGWLKGAFTNKASDKPHSLLRRATTPLVYQSLSFGSEAYTPYIKYRDRIDLANKLFLLDRPFGSFVYIQRSKHRLWPQQKVRHSGTFQIGMIGSDLGKNIQATLHKDAVVGSQKVHGWENQIANGGRWVAQYNSELDLLVSSETFSPQKSFLKQILMASGLNPPVLSGVNSVFSFNTYLGGYLTAAEIGFKFSSTDFTNRSARHSIISPRNPFDSKSYTYNSFLVFDLGVRLRHVFHNSMLEGVGYFRTFTDDIYDDDVLSTYTLNQEYYSKVNARWDAGKADRETTYPRVPHHRDEINRTIFFFDFNVYYRLRKMTVFIEYQFHSKEFQKANFTRSGLKQIVDKKDYNWFFEEVYPDIKRYEHRPYYGFGMLGFSWDIN